MKQPKSVFLGGIVFLVMCIFSVVLVNASEPKTDIAQAQESLLPALQLSNMQVRISSQGHVATFQLYNTVAARQFFEQLPLELDLSNFRNAQWMFYPPQRLSVKNSEAYHDGIKGELSYYEPWGDVFMLYEDFYAGDEMHRLGIVIEGIEDIAPMSGKISIEKHNIE